MDSKLIEILIREGFDEMGIEGIGMEENLVYISPRVFLDALNLGIPSSASLNRRYNNDGNFFHYLHYKSFSFYTKTKREINDSDVLLEEGDEEPVRYKNFENP